MMRVFCLWMQSFLLQSNSEVGKASYNNVANRKCELETVNKLATSEYSQSAKNFAEVVSLTSTDSFLVIYSS